MALKLTGLKTWLSFEDAAKYLEALLDEPVSTTDIFHLAAEGRLRLSVYFPTAQPAKCLEMVDKDEAARIKVYLPKIRGDLNEEKWNRLQRLRCVLENQGAHLDYMDLIALADYLHISRSELERLEDLELYSLYIGTPLFDGSVLEETGQEIEVRGFWNLELSGGGSIELENRYLEHIGAGRNDLIAWNGILLRAPDDEQNWIALKTANPIGSFDEQLKLVEACEKIGWSPPSRLQEQGGVTAANTLPEDSHFVIHNKELQRFTRQLENATDNQMGNERQEYPPHLEALILAWRKNWRNTDRTDRTTCPKKDEVKAWLMDQGLSAKSADAGATIIKPQWAADKGW